MKKKYEKPIAELVVFELGEAIATTCANQVYIFANANRGCSPNYDYDWLNFGSECSRSDIPNKEYCYFTPDGTNSIFDS